MRRGKLWLLAGVVVVLLFGNGCTRRFFRQRADKLVDSILVQKDQFPAWKIEQYHVYPDPRARFADPTNPDRPPMPPDDPAAHDLSPNPQKPGKPGIAYIEGDGYLKLLADWDTQNRAELEARLATEEKAPTQPPVPSPGPLYSGPEMSSDTDKGFLLKFDQAVELGLINSREYQSRREDLYLATLPVTTERFAFAAQFESVGEVIREVTGTKTSDGQHNRWRVNSEIGFSKLFCTGALLLFRFANQTFIELTGNHKHTISESTAILDLAQPLLRGGGKAVTLEPLTQVERNLLYQIRNFAHFRKEFFVSLATASDSSSFTVPTTFGIVTAVASAAGATSSSTATSSSGTTGVAGGRLPVVSPGQGTRNFFSPTSLVPVPEGFLTVLQRSAILSNERENVRALIRLLDLFRNFKEGGAVEQLQVDQVEQALLQGRATVLQRQLEYRDGIDRFKLQLGLPTNLCLELDDCPVRELAAQIERYDRVILHIQAALDQAQTYGNPAESGLLRKRLLGLFTESDLVKGTRFRTEFPKRWKSWEGLTDRELEIRLRELGEERRDLLAKRTDLENLGRNLPPADQRRLDLVESEIDLGRFEAALRAYEAEKRANVKERMFQGIVNQFNLVLVEARNERFRQLRESWPKLPNVCLNGKNLIQTDLHEALGLASQAALVNRFDLMNARAELVDAWRKIAVQANALMGVFNVSYHMDAGTPPGEAQPLNFIGSNTRHQLRMNWELPLVRVQERNAYRASLIAFQRQRRALMAFEDQTLFDVRSEMRQLRTFAENYRIQQRLVELAYLQVENSLDVFRQPPPPGVAAAGASAAATAAALTAQLLGAQRSLPQAQNALFTVWVGYLATRMQLYRDLELMPLDLRGVWIDEPSQCCEADGPGEPPGPQLPPPEILPPPRPVQRETAAGGTDPDFLPPLP